MITSSRSFSVAAAVVTAAIILVGCSTDSSSDPAADDAADGRGETRVVETKFGEVEVPADAQRIVALD